MSEFERQEPSFRLVETWAGDTLQDVAARAIGDANRWPELIWLNKLVPPYLTDDPDLASPMVLRTGSLIKIPAPAGVAAEDADTGQVYERDCQLVNKQLQDDGNGDFAIVSGSKNFVQQLSHRIVTPRGQAKRHPEYGCFVWALNGQKTNPSFPLLGSEYVRSALEADYRVSSVTRAEASVVGDVTRVTAHCEGISGAGVDVVL